MKTKFSNSDCVHVFMQRTQSHGEGYSVFFENDTLYSWGRHFILAKFVEYRGKTALLINTSHYSSSTSKHQSLASRSINKDKFDLVLAWDFKNFKFDCMWNGLDEVAVKNEVNFILSQAYGSFRAQLRARTTVHNYNDGAGLFSTAQNLAKFFGLKFVQFKPKYKLKKQAEQAYHAARANQKVQQEKQAEKEKLNAELWEKEHKEQLNAWLAGETGVLYVPRLVLEKYAKEIEKRDELIIQKWIEGKTNERLNSRFAYLRLKDRETVQTSLGVSVGLDKCLTLYKAIKAGKNVIGARLNEYYTVSNMDTEVLTIGCHRIKLTEVERFVNSI